MLGYAIYQYVLNEIYRVEGCYIRFTQDELFDCAEYWNMREEEVLRIINYCTETGLFNAGIWKQYGILTGHSIQIRYVSMCHAAKRKTVIPEEINLLSEEKSSLPVSRAQLPCGSGVRSDLWICGSHLCSLHGTFRSARSFERGNSSGKNRIYSGSLQYKGKKRKHIILKLLYIRSGKDG
ncbi:DUF4373 domain-containing protein [Phocaeicola dorei]|nr:DUF4373 domain-containing protein [Phocaeicola dorei]